MKIVLPWPAKALWPNARVHWAVKAAAVKKARQDAYWLATSQRFVVPPVATLRVTFHAPTRRRPDDDNAVSALKPARDGLADASGCDDSEWSVVPVRGRAMGGGCVIVEVQA